MASRPARMSGVYPSKAHEVQPRVAWDDALERNGPAFRLDHQHTARVVQLARSVDGAAVPHLPRASRAVAFREPIPSESYLTCTDRASSAMSVLTSSVPRFTLPIRQSVPVQRDVGILPHQQSVQRFAGRHLFALASSAVLTPFPPRRSVQHDV